jgi:hypothetical protein
MVPFTELSKAERARGTSSTPLIFNLCLTAFEPEWEQPICPTVKTALSVRDIQAG